MQIKGFFSFCPNGMAAHEPFIENRYKSFERLHDVFFELYKTIYQGPHVAIEK